jgi:hypothetical protein
MFSCIFACLLAVCLIDAGCASQPDFVQVAPGVAVSSESIDSYAHEHGISRDEAKRQLAAEATSTPARSEASP